MNFHPSRHDRPIFGKLVSEYNLTYYGTVIPGEAYDYIPVRGMTASPEQIDDNYTAGHVANYNVQLLQRSHSVYLPNNRRINHTWTICQVDLRATELPHLIICGKHKPLNDDSILAIYLRMYEINPASLGQTISDDFADKFAVYVSPQDIQMVSPLFQSDLQAMLSVHFADTDFEINNDKLYVYISKRPLQLRDLDRQLRIAIWLARYIDGLDLTGQE